jgi:hypothetical protein
MSVNFFLDHVKLEFGLKNDAALSRALKVPPSLISKLRHGYIPFGDKWVLVFHDATGYPIREIRQMVSDRLIT